ALLHVHPVADRAQVVAHMQFAGGLDAGEDALHCFHSNPSFVHCVLGPAAVRPLRFSLPQARPAGNRGRCRGSPARWGTCRRAKPRTRRRGTLAQGGMPVIAIVTDFGQSEYVGIMKGVILQHAPRAVIVDLYNEVEAQSVREGAWVLYTAYRHFPAGTVFLCVVDPGVGSD